MSVDREPRYGTRRWRKVRARVLARDLHVCRVVLGCTTPATVADHIVPATLTMPDSLFFSPGNLRAACRDHNIARGHAAKLEQPAPVVSDVVTGDYS